MTITVDAATEARITAELATGRFAGPSEVVANALTLITDARRTANAEREADQEALSKHIEMEDWLYRNREAIRADLAVSTAEEERGEGYSLEEVKKMLADKRTKAA